MYRFPADVFYQGSHFLDDVNVGLLQNHFFAGALSARLLASLLRPAYDNAFAEGVEPAYQNVAKAAAVGNQQSNGSDTPDDA